MAASGSERPSSLAAAAVVDARRDIGVREITYNSSPRIDEYIKAVGAPRRSSYCMAAVFTWFAEAAAEQGVKNPLKRTGAVWQQVKYAASYGSRMRVYHPGRVYGRIEVLAGDIACWERRGKIDLREGAVFLGHTGIVVSDDGMTVTTVEANTGPSSRVERNGDGVHLKPGRQKRKMLALLRILEISHEEADSHSTHAGRVSVQLYVNPQHLAGELDPRSCCLWANG